ncbi:SIMPL domain-containing protein [candidate division WWE3 bacterium]|uniref:SIMPL domain-containing protein n=1 Tax=candidate division WWE3 bacterium TaxID=2053526 RepID=A0A7X9DKS1_UNCKA|nr:SIMPL domain-containing protein [candidate division WWE3 bacterium]
MPLNKNIIIYTIVGLSVVLSFYFLSRTGIYIKQIGGVETGGKISNTISTAGDGKVYAKPDMAEINLSFSEMAPTSREALEMVNKKIDEAIKKATENGLSDSDISTTGLSVYTEYDYSNSGRKVLGQRATQSLSLKVRNLDVKATRAATLIDSLSTIDNAQFNGITFDIEDKTKLVSQARELAFNKSKQKAQELAKLSQVKLMKPVSITDSTYDISPKPYYANTAELRSAMGGGSADAQVPSGEIAVSTSLSILWGIE